MPCLIRYVGQSSAVLLLLATAVSTTHAASGTWTQTTSGGLWSNIANWNSGVGPIADGSGSTANFNALNITTDNTVHLDSDRILTNLIFGDTDTSSAAGWILGNNAVTTNNLILAGTTPTITVNALGAGKLATISAIIEGTDGLTKDGVGTLALSANTTNTGATIINQGTLKYLRTVSGPGYSASSGFTIASNATLEIEATAQGRFQNNNALITGTGTFKKTGGAITFLGDNTSGTAMSFDMASGGLIDVQAGTLNTVKTTATNLASLNVVTAFTLNGGNVGGGNVYVDSLTGGGAISIIAGVPSIPTPRTLTLGTDNTAILGADFTGTISNGAAVLSLTKTGTGTQKLSGINTYTGLTKISGGTLSLASVGTISSSLDLDGGTIDIAAKTGDLSLASLVGEGLIVGAGKTVTVTSAFGPGHSMGTIDVTGNLTLAGTTTSTIEVNLTNDTFDQVNVSGMMTYGGVLDVVFTGADPLGGTYDVFDFGSLGGSFTTVNFSGLSGQTATFTPGTGVVSVSAIPEPSTLVLGGLTLLGFVSVGLRRRGQRA